MSDLKKAKDILDKHFGEIDALHASKRFLSQARSRSMYTSRTYELDLDSPLGRVIADLVHQWVAKYDAEAKERETADKVMEAIARSGRTMDKEPLSAYELIVKEIGDADISPMLKLATRQYSNHVEHIIDWLNLWTTYTLPHDETAFASYLLNHYELSINWIGEECYINPDCVDDIRKLSHTR